MREHANKSESIFTIHKISFNTKQFDSKPLSKSRDAVSYFPNNKFYEWQYIFFCARSYKILSMFMFKSLHLWLTIFFLIISFRLFIRTSWNEKWNRLWKLMKDELILKTIQLFRHIYNEIYFVILFQIYWFKFNDLCFKDDLQNISNEFLFIMIR